MFNYKVLLLTADAQIQWKLIEVTISPNCSLLLPVDQHGVSVVKSIKITFILFTILQPPH